MAYASQPAAVELSTAGFPVLAAGVATAVATAATAASSSVPLDAGLAVSSVVTSAALLDQQAKLDKATKAADLIFGSVAGVAGKIVEYPFDTIKVRLQVQPLNGSAYSGSIDCIRRSLSEDGVRGLYRGLSAPLVGSMFENSVLFVTYNHIQSLIRRYSSNSSDPAAPLSMSQLSAAGFLSGACVSFVLTPVELIKCRLQAASSFRGPLSVIAHTLKTDGLAGMYRGHVGTVLREAFGGAAWFGTYELAIREFIARSPTARTKDDLPTWQHMASGAAAGIAYNAALFPADVIKSRQQSSELRESFKKVATDLYRAEGFKGFYRGFGITIARSAPTSAVIFATYEWLNKNLVVEF